MKKLFKLSSFITLATLSMITLSGCSSSSSSSSTGAAFLVSGSYSAQLTGTGGNNGNVNTELNININQTQTTTTDANGQTTTSLSPDLNGAFSFAGGTQCFRGGSITGTVNGRNISLTLTNGADVTPDPDTGLTPSQSVITLSGLQQDNNRISGTFSSNSSNGCGAFSGTFELRRR